MNDENEVKTEEQVSLETAIMKHGENIKRGLESIASALNWIAIASVLIAVTHCSGK